MPISLASKLRINKATLNKTNCRPKEVRSLKSKDITYKKMEVTPHLIRETPELIKILLKDRTTRKNIIWATDSYSRMGASFFADANIKPETVTNGAGHLVKPRVTKMVEEQTNRTRDKAEVFTPTWVVKKQNDLVEKNFKELPLEEYINKIWLEIACGEAPYMCSRYDTVTGHPIPINNRVGFIDKKLQRISLEENNHDEWLRLVKSAYKTSYGYEYQGDSLLLARENLLYTFIDYYVEKFGNLPELKVMSNIAMIISYNVFQMDGLNYSIPLSEKTKVRELGTQLSLFADDEFELNTAELVQEGKFVKIKNWENNRMIEFRSLINKGGDKL